MKKKNIFEGLKLLTEVILGEEYHPASLLARDRIVQIYCEKLCEDLEGVDRRACIETCLKELEKTKAMVERKRRKEKLKA